MPGEWRALSLMLRQRSFCACKRIAQGEREGYYTICR